MTQKSPEKREQKDSKSQNNKKSSVNHSLLEMATQTSQSNGNISGHANAEG